MKKKETVRKQVRYSIHFLKNITAKCTDEKQRSLYVKLKKHKKNQWNTSRMLLSKVFFDVMKQKIWNYVV